MQTKEPAKVMPELFANDLFDYLEPNPKFDAIVFFDVETTGFDADKDDRIIELAAIRLDRNGDIQQDDFFIRLDGRDLPEKITELTGITPIQLAMEGISEGEAAQRFVRLINQSEDWVADQTLLVAHNANFDLNFAAYLFHRVQNSDWMNLFTHCNYLDTLTVYKDRKPYPHKLANAIEAYGLQDKVQNTHRAIDDVLALYEVTKAMYEERSDLTQYVNIFGYNPRYGVSGRTFKKVKYHDQGFHTFMTNENQTLPAIVRRMEEEREKEMQTV